MTQLFYVVPAGQHQPFEARLIEIARRLGLPLLATSLAALAREHVFASPTLPNVVVVRDGEIVAHGIGDLPARELERLVHAG